MINLPESMARLEPFFGATAAIQANYKTVFDAPGSRAVLMDLARFCFACAPTTTEREQGMRDVWLHIQKRLALRDEELFAINANLPPHERLALFDRKPFHYSPR